MTARQKGVKLTCELGPDVHGEFVGDGPRIRQVITNLAGNAIKFTHEGEVLVSGGVVCLHEGVETVRVEGHDSEVGLPQAARAQLFQPFTQADGSTIRRFGGTGRRLAISLRMVELMGGVIDYDSKEGEGSTFWFEIPLVRGDSRAARARAQKLKQVRTLVVAADADRRRSLVSRLRGAGVVADEATGAEGAVHRLTSARCGLDQGSFQCLIVLDDLCGMTASDLAALVRVDGAYENLPMVLVGEEDSQSAKSQLFTRVWPETIAVEVLIEQLRRMGAEIGGRSSVPRAGEEPPIVGRGRQPGESSGGAYVAYLARPSGGGGGERRGSLGPARGPDVRRRVDGLSYAGVGWVYHHATDSVRGCAGLEHRSSDCGSHGERHAGGQGKVPAVRHDGLPLQAD
ncbi:MAG: hypothetical protein J6386_04970 [Candidatus Synoicihabitans palmerolidicus]|nr:hypothetical protein [Candidatus Synoicihabitans palmerolidicus]